MFYTVTDGSAVDVARWKDIFIVADKNSADIRAAWLVTMFCLVTDVQVVVELLIEGTG